MTESLWYHSARNTAVAKQMPQIGVGMKKKRATVERQVIEHTRELRNISHTIVLQSKQLGSNEIAERVEEAMTNLANAAAVIAAAAATMREGESG